jgi:hypothetical protein
MYSNDIYGFILIGKVKFQPELRNIKKLLQMQDIITVNWLLIQNVAKLCTIM